MAHLRLKLSLADQITVNYFMTIKFSQTQMNPLKHQSFSESLLLRHYTHVFVCYLHK